MAAGKYENDIITSLGDTWHMMHKVPESGVIDLESSGLNWGVSAETVHDKLGAVVPDTQLIIRDDIRLPLSVRGDQYVPLQNSRLFDIIDSAFSLVGYVIETAGSVNNCKDVWTTFRLKNEDNRLVNGDEFRNFWNLMNSHTGRTNVRLFDSRIRVVCANTFSMALKEGKGSASFAIPHFGNPIKGIVDSLASKVESLLKYREEFYTSMEYLANRPMTMEQANAILVNWKADKGKLSGKAASSVREMATLFKSGKGNNGASAYDLFNGVTEYYTSGNGSGSANVNPWKKVQSSEFGTAMGHKAGFFEMLTTEDIDSLVAEGMKLLESKEVKEALVG